MYNYYDTYSPVYNFFSPQKKIDVLKVIKIHDADRTIIIKMDKLDLPLSDTIYNSHCLSAKEHPAKINNDSSQVK